MYGFLNVLFPAAFSFILILFKQFTHLLTKFAALATEAVQA